MGVTAKSIRRGRQSPRPARGDAATYAETTSCMEMTDPGAGRGLGRACPPLPHRRRIAGVSIDSISADEDGPTREARLLTKNRGPAARRVSRQGLLHLPLNSSRRLVAGVLREVGVPRRAQERRPRRARDGGDDAARAHRRGPRDGRPLRPRLHRALGRARGALRGRGMDRQRRLPLRRGLVAPPRPHVEAPGESHHPHHRPAR